MIAPSILPKALTVSQLVSAIFVSKNRRDYWRKRAADDARANRSSAYAQEMLEKYNAEYLLLRCAYELAVSRQDR